MEERKILGIDLGTNSLGWAVLEEKSKGDLAAKLLGKGVVLFDEGVLIEKGTEKSRAAERTEKRSARRRNFRRKLRKYETLKVLAKSDMVPLSLEEIEKWRQSNFTQYPLNKEFIDWLRTDDNINKNPYYLRAKAVNEKLSAKDLGRVFYHLAQRRGFLSNRKERGKSKETGEVKESIKRITERIKQSGAKTLGEYFWMLYQKDRKDPGNQIRRQYLGRKEHYVEEFDQIIKFQYPDLIDEKFPLIDPLKRYKGIAKALYKAIFYQRPLKSQKGLVGNCVFEPKKTRIPVSHPLFEEFRMWQILNNIKIKFNFQQGDLFSQSGADKSKGEGLRFLTEEEKLHLIPLFEKSPSKSSIKIKDLVKEILKLYPEYKKAKIAYYKSREARNAHLLINYPLEQSVSTSPVRALFRKYLGDDWEQKIYRYNVQKNNGIVVEKSADYIDIWHVLFTFEDEVLLKNYFIEKIGLEEEVAEKFVNFTLPDGYASLSHKAISLILPFLKQGYTYDKAVLLAKIPEIVGSEIWQVPENQQAILQKVEEIFNKNTYWGNIKSAVNATLREIYNPKITDENAIETKLNSNLIRFFGKKFPVQAFEDAVRLLGERLVYSKLEQQIIKQETIEQQLKNYLKNEILGYEGLLKAMENAINEEEKEAYEKKLKEIEKRVNKLYHPSMTEIYPKITKSIDGKIYLGSPIINSIKNPVMMRSLHMLRKLVNKLLNKGLIDNDTVIHLELAREVDDANKRRAIQQFQKEREKENKTFSEEIKKHFQSHGINREPSREDIRRYRLWKEQGEIDIYTGETIPLEKLFDGNAYDIEHTVPQSISFDNSLANLTITSSRFNREIKRNKIPSQLDQFTEIKERLAPWQKIEEDLKKQIAKINTRGIDSKEAKDRLITKRHLLRMKWEYWNKKINNFLVKEEELTERFKVSQLTDTRVITKYARAYLKSAFPIVHVVNGYMVSEFRKLWGLQDEDEKKSRENHVHHAIDAAVIASMRRPLYNKLVEAYRKQEEGLKNDARQLINDAKPWPTFTEDLKNFKNQIFVYHDFRDLLPKHTKKKWRKRGKIQYVIKEKLPQEIKNLADKGILKNGKDFYQLKDGRWKVPVYLQGDTARGSLHRETFYGAIAKKDDKGQIIKNNEGQTEVVYVVRKYVDDLNVSDAQKIVDPVIRHIVIRDLNEKEKIKKQLEEINKKLRNTTQEEEKKLIAEKEQLLQKQKTLFRLPTKKGDYVPIKKVRVYTRINNPIPEFKKHRDLSKLSYKQWYYVENEENYAMAIYEGTDKNGKIKRDYEIIKNIEAAEYFKRSNKAYRKNNPLLQDEKNGLKLKYIIKKGMSVLFYKESPEELKELTQEELVKRLFILYSLEGVNIRFKPSQVGGQKKDFEQFLTSKLIFDNRHSLRISKKNWNFVLNGVDFVLEIDGTIKWFD